MHTATLTGGLFEQRPVTMQEVADAHDTCRFVLARELDIRLDFRHHVRLTAMRPHAYVECTTEFGWALWTSPEWRVYHYLPYHTTNRFAFEISADFVHYEVNQPSGTVVPRKPLPPRQMTDDEAAARLHTMESAARCAGAELSTLRIDFARRVVTGEYLYLPDHPVVSWVRAFGVMPYEGADGKPVPAVGTPYPYKKPVEYVPVGHPRYLAYSLRWDGGDTCALTEQGAREQVERWRGQGLVLGSLQYGKVVYQDGFGRVATITRYTGPQHRLDSIDPATGRIR